MDFGQITTELDILGQDKAAQDKRHVAEINSVLKRHAISNAGPAPAISVVTHMESFYRWEYEWIRWLLSDFRIEDVYDPELGHISDRVVLVLGGETRPLEKRIPYYLGECARRGAKVGVIHLSDEWGIQPTFYYRDAAFVYRNYWKAGLIDGRHCHYLPLGYSAGLPAYLPATPKPIDQRQYRWSFLGQPKRSRWRMLENARRIPGGIEHVTSQWEDPKGFSRQKYAEILTDSIFALCPVGNASADTWRFYEALEAGAIPIVEETGGSSAWKEMLSPSVLFGSWTSKDLRSRARKMLSRSYWQQAYGAYFPCPRICDWGNLESTLRQIDIVQTSQNVSRWWQQVKVATRAHVAATIRSTFGLAPQPAAEIDAACNASAEPAIQ